MIEDFAPAALLLALSAGLSWLGTGWARRYALARNVMDVPNERSSHLLPTPRGGGVAIVLSFLVATWALAVTGGLAPAPAWALCGAGALVAAAGFADDRWGLPARWRFLAHFASSLWVLAWLWPAPAISGWGLTVAAPWALVLSFALLVTWSINLFNFMDGIDGIASLETIAVAAGGACLGLCVPLAPGGITVPLALLACTAGFLVWNWPPAKIFMGDAGSGFLGLAVATLAIWQSSQAPQLFWSWMILMGCFMVDATTTLLRRVKRGEKFYAAHRSHAYQFGARKHGAHLPVTLACGAITVLWLLPLACAVALQWLDGAWGLVIAYAPLVRLAFVYRAGDAAAQAQS